MEFTPYLGSRTNSLNLIMRNYSDARITAIFKQEENIHLIRIIFSFTTWWDHSGHSNVVKHSMKQCNLLYDMLQAGSNVDFELLWSLQYKFCYQSFMPRCFNAKHEYIEWKKHFSDDTYSIQRIFRVLVVELRHPAWITPNCICNNLHTVIYNV
jgi:hypothetical protein